MNNTKCNAHTPREKNGCSRDKKKVFFTHSTCTETMTSEALRYDRLGYKTALFRKLRYKYS